MIAPVPTKAVVDLDRAIVINPKHAIGWGADITKHATEYAAWLANEDCPALHRLAAAAGLLTLSQSIWRLTGRPEHQVAAKGNEWWIALMEHLNQQALALARPGGLA